MRLVGRATRRRRLTCRRASSPSTACCRMRAPSCRPSTRACRRMSRRICSARANWWSPATASLPRVSSRSPKLAVGFFATFWSWLNGQLATYIGDNTARAAVALEPAVVTLATVYVMVWGYLQLTGRIEEPLVTGLRRLLTLALVIGGALHLWLYNNLIVDTFYRAPAQLAAAI